MLAVCKATASRLPDVNTTARLFSILLLSRCFNKLHQWLVCEVLCVLISIVKQPPRKTPTDYRFLNKCSGVNVHVSGAGTCELKMLSDFFSLINVVFNKPNTKCNPWLYFPRMVSVMTGSAAQFTFRLIIRRIVFCSYTYSKGKTPRRPGPRKASNTEKDPVGVSHCFTCLLYCSS